MFQSKFNRLIVAGIAAAADRADVGHGPRRGRPRRRAEPLDLRAPDQVDGTQVSKVVPVNPQPIKTVAPTSATSDNGIDDGVLIALGGGALLLVAGVGVAGRKRLQVVRQRQLA